MRSTATSSRRSSTVVSPGDQLLLGQVGRSGREHVDDLVALHELLGRLPVPGQQGVGGTGDGLAHQGEDLDEEPVDLRQDGRDGLGSGVRRVRRCHAGGGYLQGRLGRPSG